MWKESSVPPDSSSSETGKDTPPESNVVHFTVGDGPVEPVRASSKEKSNIVRSYSQDTSIPLAVDDKTTSSFLSKSSYSENSLDSSSQDRSGQQKIGPTTASTTSINSATTTSTSSSSKKALKEPQQQSTVDDETLSTDSNSTTDNDELKKRRRKMLFTFRKNKSKTTL